MANRLLIGMMDGQMRLRIARPPYDVLNPYLTNEQLVIDSTWRDNFALWEYGYERMSTVVEAPIVGGTGYWHEITFSRALSYTPTAFAWEGYSTGTITPRETYVFGDRIRVLIRAKLGAQAKCLLILCH